MSIFFIKMDQIRGYFERFVALSEVEWHALAAKMQMLSLPKKSLLLKEGEICRHIALIEQGSFRFYHVKEGDEKVTAFFFAGDAVTNYRSFLTQTPSDHYIEAMQEARLFLLAREDLQGLYQQHPKLERLGRLIAESLYLTVAKRLDSFLYDKPEDRYQDLLDRNSRLLQEVPQYMIASYLGVKPETLSRIRRRQ